MIGNGRLENQIAALGETLSRRLKRLRESTLDVYADLGLKNIYRDWDTFDPELYPVANYIPPFYQDKRLRGETIPLYQNEYQLKVIRDKSRVLCALNEYAICGIENRKNYIIGTGLTYTAYPRDPNLAKHKKLCSKLQDFLDLADDYADLDEHAAEDLERQDEDGESFTRLFFKSNGMTEVRFIEPEYVCSPHGMTDDPQTSFGIITPPDDTATAEAYTVGNMPYPKVPTNWEEIPASEIVHNKNRSKKANKRGVPLFTPAMNKLKRAEEMLDSLSTMAKARAKIALIRQITGLTQDTATRLQTLLTKVRVTDPYTNEVLNIDQLRNGTILTTNQNGGYQFPSANVEANQFVEVLQAELRGVAGMLQMPEWMLTAVADAKYSNAFVVEGTAYRAFTRIQNKICKRYGSARFGNQQSVVWRMVKHAIQAGLLPYEVLECCRIEAAGPTLKTRNDAEEANTNKTYIEMGVRSKRTVQERIGDDPDTENAYLLAEQQQKNRERVAESPQAILQIQTAYTKGEIARPAAIGLAMTVYGFTSEDCDKLFPEVEAKDYSAAGNKPQQPPGGIPGGPPTDTPPTGQTGAGTIPNPLESFPRLAESTIRVGSLSRHTKILLREAGFTGTVTAKNGAVFYYEDGRRVANPNKKEGPKKQAHATKDKAKELQSRAREAFDFAINNLDKLTADHVRNLPHVIAVLPKAELEAYASKLGYKVKEKYKQDTIDKIAKLFPVPQPKVEKTSEGPSQSDLDAFHKDMAGDPFKDVQLANEDKPAKIAMPTDEKINHVAGQLSSYPPSAVKGDLQDLISYADNGATEELGKLLDSKNLVKKYVLAETLGISLDPASVTEPALKSAITAVLTGQTPPPVQKPKPPEVGDQSVKFDDGTTINLKPGFSASFFRGPSASKGTKPQTIEYMKHINDDDATGISDYTNGHYSDLNSLLYTGKFDPNKDSYITKTDKRLQSAFSKAPKLSEPITVYRGMDLPHGKSGEDFVAAMERAHKSGNPIEWRSYQSTGSVKEKAWSGSVQFEIRNVTEGAIDVNPISSNYGESEILLNRGTKYRIVGYTKEPGSYGATNHKIIMEQVPSDA